MGNKSQSLVDALFDEKQFNEAKTYSQSEYVREGRYFARIDNVKFNTGRKNNTSLLVEMTTVHVLNDADGTGHRVGDSITHCMSMNSDYFYRDLKAFLKGAAGLAEEVSKEDLKLIVADDQPLAGTVVEMDNKLRTTAAGKAFTTVNHKREVPASELLEVLSEAVIDKFFPDDELKKRAKLED